MVKAVQSHLLFMHSFCGARVHTLYALIKQSENNPLSVECCQRNISVYGNDGDWKLDCRIWLVWLETGGWKGDGNGGERIVIENHNQYRILIIAYTCFRVTCPYTLRGSATV